MCGCSLSSLQVGEVWDEVRRDLSLDSVRPISPDEDALSSVCRMSEDTARMTMMEQTSILELQQEEELSEELLFYQEVQKLLLYQEVQRGETCLLFQTQISDFFMAGHR